MLGVDLDEDHDAIFDSLLLLGVEEPQALELARVAVKFASEETAALSEELIPEPTWHGRVVCRRHLLAGRRPMYLVLQRHEKTWRLQSALID